MDNETIIAILKIIKEANVLAQANDSSAFNYLQLKLLEIIQKQI